jgi:hypothetical protein
MRLSVSLIAAASLSLTANSVQACTFYGTCAVGQGACYWRVFWPENSQEKNWEGSSDAGKRLTNPLEGLPSQARYCSLRRSKPPADCAAAPIWPKGCT